MMALPRRAPQRQGAERSDLLTTVAAAETFIRQRMSGKCPRPHRLDRVRRRGAVVTPSRATTTTSAQPEPDGDWTEFMKFPDQERPSRWRSAGTGLFKAFDFLDAAAT
jgi:hypothetical protein